MVDVGGRSPHSELHPEFIQAGFIKRKTTKHSFLIPTTRWIASCWLRVPDKEDIARHLTDKMTRLLSKELRKKVELHLRLCFFLLEVCVKLLRIMSSPTSVIPSCAMFHLLYSKFPVCLFTGREIMVCIAFIFNTPQYWSPIHASVWIFDIGARFIIALNVKRTILYSGALVFCLLFTLIHHLLPFFDELSFRLEVYGLLTIQCK